jgi:ankyrin repeat protein
VDLSLIIVQYARVGDVDAPRAALDTGGDVNLASIGIPLLSYAAANGHVDVVELLIQHGARVDALDYSTQWTPLHHACAHGRIEVVKKLVAGGCNINVVASDDITPFWVAVERHNITTATFLIDAGGDVKLRLQITPDHHAKSRAVGGAEGDKQPIL